MMDADLAAAFRAWDADLADMRMTPLIVTARLMAPVAVNRPEDVQLDGILAHAALAWLTDGELERLGDPQQALTWIRLPLRLDGPDAGAQSAVASGTAQMTRDLAGHWWWRAVGTAVLDGMSTRDVHYWNKRFDTAPTASEHLDFADKSAKVVIEVGRYKSYHQPLPVLTTRAIAWPVVGHADGLRLLLDRVGHIGKKRSQGEGKVRRWEIAPTTRDGTLWTAGGALARPVPVAALPPDVCDAAAWVSLPVTQHIAYRAPGWHPANQALCVLGGERA